MNHPILHNRSYILYYTLISILLTIIQFLILHLFISLNIKDAIIDSSVFIVIFAFIGLSIWYTVYFNNLETKKLYYLIFSHLITAIIAVTVWIVKSWFITTLLVDDIAAYNNMFKQTLYLRIIQGILGYIIIVLFYYLIIFLKTNKQNKQREESLIALVRDAELKSLKSQINPHFLFNSLNSISSLTMFDPDKAQAMIIKLSDYLRFSLQFKPHDTVTFEKEIENIQRYLEIEKIRFGKRLAMNFTIDEHCNKIMVPTMILQPLFENAIKYGVHENTRETLITVTVQKEHSFMKFSISNNYDPDSIVSKGQGIGLSNIKERMNLLYGTTELVKIKNDNNNFTVTIFFPDNHPTL